jgi:tetratricopeptide (TPR) repeat protein
MKAAETWVANRPDSPEAQYALGSWLIYGYRVRHVRELVVDPERGETTRMTPRVVQGMSDDVEPGLAALKRAMVLAPGTGKYALDYAAALFDCDRPYEAMGLLKRAWAGDVNLTASEKLRTGLILSNIYVSQGNLVDAREWVYSALESNPENSAAAEQLRWLDSMQSAGPPEALIPTESIPESDEAEDVEAPDEMSTGDTEEVTPVE